ncbi:MAG TPA: primosomal protein N', partial [Gemmatimonadaceae bacterium]|nr:primosomal protein N' [Gemmatimonadaceae bacterium]
GNYRLLSLPERVGGGSLPRIEIVDRRQPHDAQVGASGGRLVDPFSFVIGDRLADALRVRLARGEQSILLLNRRGYAAFVQCGECGDVAVCPNCSISLTLHRTPARLVCHYCQHAEPPRTTCGRCGGLILRHRGVGTQQVERILGERFAGARIARMDVDTTSGRWAHMEILDRVGRGDVDILLGTQMIAKGLDFPNVTLVGVVDADVGINLPDFRASERCFQLLAQVAGRAGRGPKGGEVVIQTRAPGHHAVRCAVTHDYERFVAEELEGRRAPLYPPFVRLARFVASGLAEASTAGLAERAATWLRAVAEDRGVKGLAVIGAAPCPVERIKNRWRWHVLIKAEEPRELTRIARYFMGRFSTPGQGDARIVFDRDPVAML